MNDLKKLAEQTAKAIDMRIDSQSYKIEDAEGIILAALEQAQSGWRLIESAPKGEWIVGTIEGMSRGYFGIVAHIDNSWVIKTPKGCEPSFVSGFGIPTHWMPLPNPPPKMEE